MSFASPAARRDRGDGASGTAAALAGGQPQVQDQHGTSWVVSYGSRGKTGTAGYRITGWGTNAQPKTVQGTVEVTDQNQGLADAEGPISELEGKRIAILGDSYSSGEGSGDYMQGTDEVKLHLGPPVNQCHKSPNTYMYPLFAESDVELIACSDAKTHYVGDDKNGVIEEQVPLLRERQEDSDEPVSAAFMTIGGNDIQFSRIVRHCLLGHPTVTATWWTRPRITWDTRCSDDWDFREEVDAMIRELSTELMPTYRQVSLALNSRKAVDARGGDAVPLYILAYPQPFQSSNGSLGV